MLKEKWENTKQFVKEHKTEIILGTITIAGVAFLGYKLKDKNIIQNVNDEVIDDGTNNKIIDNFINDRIARNENGLLEQRLDLDTLYDIGYRSLDREDKRIRFEIEELQTYIENLDHTKNINKFHRIPEKEAMIETLKIQLNEIEIDKDQMKEIMEIVWGKRD